VVKANRIVKKGASRGNGEHAALGRGTEVTEPAVDVEEGEGAATGVVGLYVTPLMLAAASNTEPPPYS